MPGGAAQEDGGLAIATLAKGNWVTFSKCLQWGLLNKASFA